MILLPLFADQLTPDIAALRAADKATTTVLMMEVAAEADMVWHHRKKLVFLFSAMRHFAAALTADGWRVRYVRLDDAANGGSFDEEVARAVTELSPEAILLTEPGEWRVEQMALGWEARHGLPVTILPDDRFLCSRADFAGFAQGRKSLLMETFYRAMRKRTGLLMDGEGPRGGRWNYDAENREPASPDLFLPHPPSFPPDAVTADVLAMVAARFPDRFGDLDGFDLPVTAQAAHEAAIDFLDKRLPGFGATQDAMLTGHDVLNHAMLSPAINAGLLDPLWLCREAEARLEAGEAPIAAVEGFIRQIIGWREYVRGVYWLAMPDYADSNALGATRELPWFYWSGETRMACVATVVDQTRRLAWAHHIHRLMVTGTFALLAGLAPRQVHEWYLAVYADAYEWVEMPNVLGMSLYADGGLMGSKPYAASGAYIDRMSDYCGRCHYAVKQKTGPRSCPFNSLYWDFLARNRDTLGGNRRLAMPYRSWDRMDPERQRALRSRAAEVLALMEAGEL